MKQIVISGNIGELLRADFDAGKLFWLKRSRDLFASARSHSTWNARYAGAEALTFLDAYGYLCGRLFNRPIKSHRAIWSLATGEWPEAIDHINGNRSDNRLVNLRAATAAINNRNSARRSDNISGYTGVCFDVTRGRWLVTASSRYVGRFDNIGSAIDARAKAVTEQGYHQNHGAKR